MRHYQGDKIKFKDIADELKLSNPKSIFEIKIPEEGIDYKELEKELLKKALIKSNFVIARAAKILSMSYKTFWYRLKKYELLKNLPKWENLPKWGNL